MAIALCVSIAINELSLYYCWTAFCTTCGLFFELLFCNFRTAFLTHLYSPLRLTHDCWTIALCANFGLLLCHSTTFLLGIFRGFSKCRAKNLTLWSVTKKSLSVAPLSCHSLFSPQKRHQTDTSVSSGAFFVRAMGVFCIRKKSTSALLNLLRKLARSLLFIARLQRSLRSRFTAPNCSCLVIVLTCC